AFLRRWKEEILTKIERDEPAASGVEQLTTVVDRRAELRLQIESAITEERYEDAAMLRDELKRLDASNDGTN
ncbi:MAG TPA: hypothetical protein VHE81_10500, partial [Lacipirellulaceae bacterium]|nr:hypothetical protein [Lacipirellulaceae bacterium]